ncbi:uncharacterized protein [Equus przewalskii]|uniref:Uncharacterized protein n=1 Tax=Equus przewalskii TaxID=9798 RepID=A0ABM4JU33_EQUPR
MPLEGTGHGSPSQAHTDLPRPACPAAPTTLSPPASPSLPRLLRHSGPHRPQAMGEYQPKSPSRTASLCSVPSTRQRRRRGSRNTGGVSFSPGISCCLDAENLKELDPNLGYLVTKEVSQKFHLLFPNVALELKGLRDSRWPWGSLDEIQHTFVFPKSACQDLIPTLRREGTPSVTQGCRQGWPLVGAEGPREDTSPQMTTLRMR